MTVATTMTTHEPTPSDASPWPAAGVHVLDTATGRVGVVQLLRDASGKLLTEGIQDPARVLLRPEGQREPLWWADAADCVPAPGDVP